MFGHSGQKCSAQSIMFMHKNWNKTNLLDQIKAQAEKRNLKDLTIAPVMTWNNEKIKAHVDQVLLLDGAKLICGGKPLEEKHSIPSQYGSFQPTLVYVPLKHFNNRAKYNLLTTELFGPFSIVSEFGTSKTEHVLKYLENMTHHLTAAVVSNDPIFTDKILGSTVNGTTYAGLRARTTGAPQNHWFGPSGDPRGAGIGTDEAIQLVWSHHREIVTDVGPIAEGWESKGPI